MAVVAQRHLNEWERPQRRHYGGHNDNVELEHNFETRGEDAKTLAKRRQFVDSAYSRHIILDATESMPRPTTGKRTYGAGPLAHSYDFLSTQSGLAGVSTGSPATPSATQSARAVRRMNVSKPADHDLLLEHDLNTTQNRSVVPDPMIINHPSSPAGKVPQKRHDYTHKVQVEQGGSCNFFEMPEDRRRHLAFSSQRNQESDPMTVKFFSQSDPRIEQEIKRVVGVQRRKKFDWVPDFTKRDVDAPKDPKKHIVPKPAPQLSDEKRHLQEVMSNSHYSTCNPAAGLSSDHWRELDHTERRALREDTATAGDIFKESWDFLKHQVPQTLHTQEPKANEIGSPVRPQSGRAGVASIGLGDAEGRQDRLKRHQGTSVNILSGEVNPFSRRRNFVA